MSVHIPFCPNVIRIRNVKYTCVNLSFELYKLPIVDFEFEWAFPFSCFSVFSSIVLDNGEIRAPMP